MYIINHNDYCTKSLTAVVCKYADRATRFFHAYVTAVFLPYNTPVALYTYMGT